MRCGYLAVTHDGVAPQIRIHQYPIFKKMTLKACSSGIPFSIEIDARRLLQLADLGEDLLSPHPIRNVIGIVRYSGHSNHHRVRETVLGIHFHYTSLEMGHHRQGSSYRRLHFSKAHMHLDRMHVKRESIQKLVSGVCLRHFLKHAPQDVPRDLIPPPETEPYRSVLLIVRKVERYAHHITGFEIAQRIFKQLVHTIVKMSCGVSRRRPRRRSRHPHSQISLRR